MVAIINTIAKLPKEILNFIMTGEFIMFAVFMAVTGFVMSFLKPVLTKFLGNLPIIGNLVNALPG